MKILFVSENYPPYIDGGAEISTSLLAAGLAKEHEISVVCGDFSKNSWIENGVSVYPIIPRPIIETKGFAGVIHYGWSVTISPIISSIKLLRLINWIKPDAINFVATLYAWIPMIILIKLFTRRKILIDCRDYTLICPAQFKGDEIEDPLRTDHGYECIRRAQKSKGGQRITLTIFAVIESWVFNFYKSLLKYLINHSSNMVLVPNSRYVQNQLISNGFVKEKTVVIYNISPEFNIEENIEKAKIPTFSYAGRLEKEKGIWDIIKAAEILEKKIGNNFSIQIAGLGSEYESLKRYVVDKKLKSVTFLGRIEPEEVLKLYKKSLAILAPSIWPEPFGRFILESISVGTIVVSTNTGGTTEEVKSGITGFLINPADYMALSKIVEFIIKTPELIVGMESKIVQNILKYKPVLIVKQRELLYRS